MRILIAFGTRPEIIKLGPVYRALAAHPGIQVDAYWTGQHIELATGLLQLFDITVTCHGEAVMNEPGLAEKFGLMTNQIAATLRATHYDWIVVQGDTITASAAATAGFLSRVPVAHVEAGLRTGNLYSPWPEEYNRRAISVSASLHFPPTVESANNLLNEGVAPASVITVGNTVVDALLFARTKVGEDYAPIDPGVAEISADKKLILATMHRRENIGGPMRDVLRALRSLAEDGDKVVALPVHLNPEVRSDVMGMLGGIENVRLLAPLQYLDFVHLLSRAWLVVSDSGGVQEEAPTFGLPILITRNTTERPEVVTAGFGTLVGSNYDAITAMARDLTQGNAPRRLGGSNPFGDGTASVRIADALIARNLRQSIAA
ncbi:non-hydrolyzing UDP-N-acetylglucosamine 2-epimerase [Methylobacterium nodulans]|uniref:UDP-N-acetylglucosamine 2-epimerase (non-hydrolyzing) n=1 Tax=Methylobacterium nodulans (strain LMG 21967 / CNCM I-2342 / ORS 2060) TaxID=460265 RepID=B8ICV3_METNO|nr:UDP-N-acetylglucosamine 2-epimerase (non-hydrolyzing) [Methylobacterium nodulans]ACL57514.1 UDP-N-acetylglucosamine 2-epimerase [Methylobacterium nodulans ORS 2060]